MTDIHIIAELMILLKHLKADEKNAVVLGKQSLTCAQLHQAGVISLVKAFGGNCFFSVLKCQHMWCRSLKCSDNWSLSRRNHGNSAGMLSAQFMIYEEDS